ncbi:MAG: ABC transporter permease [Vicinamibacterales bacterium]
MIRDLRDALRSLAATPGVTTAAVLSLAIGIGANTALFSVANGLLLRPLPYADADRLVILWNRSPGLNIAEDWFSTAQYFDIKTGHHGFEELAVAIGANYNLTGGGGPERVGVIRVSSNLLPMIGARAAYGRLFTPDEDAPGQATSAVLSYAMWARRYGRDPNVVGTSIVLNGQGYRIAGVLPASFSLPREVLPTLGVAEDGEIFLPLPMAANAATVRTREDYNIVGKLARGVSVAQAQAEMDAITARLRRDFPDNYPPNGGLTFSIVPLMEQVVGNVRRPLLLLWGAVGLVLLIACANVANLMLARALARRREIAVRVALGAGRARIVGQLLTESLLLSFAGGAVGVILARASLAWIHAVQPSDVPRLQAIAIDGRVLAFTLVVSVASGCLFGLAPALGTGRLDLHATLKDTGRGAAGPGAVWRRGHGQRRLLVVAELALSVMLLVGAGLLVRSFAQLQTVAPGFDPTGVLTLELTMSGQKYANSGAVLDAYRQLWERVDHLPGVTASGGVSALPLSGYFSWGPITVEGRTPAPGEAFLNADERVVGGRYFGAMGIPLLSGRFFTDEDTAESPRVIIVDEFMARELWPAQDAVGKRIRLGDAKSNGPWQTVIGVVGRVKQYSLDVDGRIALYLPHRQASSRALYAVVRTRTDPAGLAPSVGAVVHDLDPDLPLYHVKTMSQRVEGSLARQRFLMVLLGLFAGVALVLAVVGIYGVMAYLVSQGTRELGIRIALGATPRRILGLVLQQGLVIAVTGIAIGLAGAAVVTGLLRSLLFGVRHTDPVTFLAVGTALGAIALIATYVPAQRATRIDPIRSLRND